MKVVFLKNNNLEYKKEELNGFKFKPRNKNINTLNVIDSDILGYVLIKKINKEINKSRKAIELIIKSNVAIESDCDIMIDEIFRITNKLEYDYRIYLDEFDYFECVKELYFLYQTIICKKKIIRGMYEEDNI